MTSNKRRTVRDFLLRLAQFINRNTTWLNGIKGRLGISRIAEGLLVKKLTSRQIQEIRESFCHDYISKKIAKLQAEGVEVIHFYIFLVQSIGDIVANEPIARYLKSLVPASKVRWIVHKNFSAVLEYNPNIDEVVKVNSFSDGEDLCKTLSERHGNIIVDCHFNGLVVDAERGPHRNPVNAGINVYTHYYFGPLLSSFSTAAGLPPLDEAPVFHLRPNLCRPDFGVSDYVVFHCRSNEPARDWCSRKWNLLAQSLAKDGFTIVEIGTTRVISKNYNGMVIDYTGRKDLQELAVIVRDARLFIGIDSAFGHIANCFRTESIVVLGKYKKFDTYLPYSGPFPRSDGLTIVRAPDGCAASRVGINEVLAAARGKLGE